MAVHQSLSDSEMAKKVSYLTLGCKLNFSETSTYAREFAEADCERAAGKEKADIYIINTCSVTERADSKCRNAIRKIHKQAPDATIAVTGCYAQLKPEEILKIDGVDIVLGAGFKPDLVKKVLEVAESKARMSCVSEIDSVSNIFPAYSSGDRTRSFLKIQDGCDYRCSYCTVPLARGGSRNVPSVKVLEQAREISALGVKEIVLTGVNTGDYGKTTGENLLDLLKGLNEVEGIERYRISSIEPNLLTEEIISWIASGTKFMPHFHIPIQSGCDKVLKEMHRRYTAAMFEDKISLIRDYMEKPEERYGRVFFGIDVIVGFPGETDEDFEQTYRLLERVRPAFLHIFPYSRRKGTPAAERKDQVREGVKTERAARLQELSDRLHAGFCKANSGRTAWVLFESTVKGGMMFGYTDNYIRVEKPYDKSAIGRIVETEIQ